MEHIAPPLQLILNVKRAIESGNSVRSGLLMYVQTDSSEFSQDVSKWVSLMDQGLKTTSVIHRQRSQYRRSLLELLERAMHGESVHLFLCQLEIEIIDACHDEIARKLSKLPFLLLAPLLLMQFPAFLMLLFGPLLQNFFHSLGAG
jgi:hypothetical protein